MQPEILHRCRSCGASLRNLGEPELFCPECGKALADTPTEQPNRSEEPDNAAATPDDVAQAVSETADSHQHPSHKKGATAKAAGIVRQGGEKTRQTLHRASTAARGAIEDNVKRVEKIHHVSTVVLEEATYDPSLRFVLVALGLFVVFVILLVLSKVMG